MRPARRLTVYTGSLCPRVLLFPSSVIPLGQFLISCQTAVREELLTDAYAFLTTLGRNKAALCASSMINSL